MNRLIGLIMGNIIALGGAFCANVNASYEQTQSFQQSIDEEKESIIKQIYPDSEWIQPDLKKAKLRQNKYSKEFLKEWQNDKELELRTVEENGKKSQRTVTTKHGNQILEVTLRLPQEYENCRENILNRVEIAIQRLYNNDCLVKTDDIYINIIEKADDQAVVASYNITNNILFIKSSQLNKDNLTDIIAHELMHKYSYQNLGHLPIWLDEGFSTQFDKLGYFDITQLLSDDLPNIDLEKNFSCINDYPSDESTESIFYSFNQRFINYWLKNNDFNLGGLIQRLKQLVRDQNQEEANIILRNYLMNNIVCYKNTGGKAILEQLGFIIPKSWNLSKWRCLPPEIQQAMMEEYFGKD